MIDVDADGTRARRTTWIVGGVLFITAAFFWLAAQAAPYPVLGWASIVLLSGGMAVFALGLGRSGSVTARRPLGTAALLGLAVWNAAAPVLVHFVPATGDPMLTVTSEVVGLALAIVAVTQIARIGVLPPAWRWAPLWALVAVVAARMILTGFMTGAITASQELLVGLSPLMAILTAAAECFVGVVAIVLATRRDAVTVFGR